MEEFQDDLKAYSEEVKDVLSDPPKSIYKWGNTMLLVFITLLLVLSWHIKYPDIIRAKITITTILPPEKLIAKSTGKIERILVSNNDMVGSNTPLAIIENTANHEDVFLLKNTIDSTKVNMDDFMFPIDKFQFLQLGDVENALTLFERDYLIYRQYKEFHPHQIKRRSQNIESIQLQERLNILLEQRKIGQSELELLKKELNRYKQLYEKGVVSTQEWESKSLGFLQKNKRIKSLGTEISQIKSSINDLNENRQGTMLSQNKDDINLLRNVLQSFNSLKKSISNWEIKYVLRSSIAGKVSFLQIWTKNQNIVAGEQVFSIISENHMGYIGKASLMANNSGKIRIGQDVNIRLMNYSDSEFGMLLGKVKSISLTPDSNGNLLIDISLPRGLETTYQEEIVFQQEMSGTAEIITEDLRLIERLFYQIRGAFKR